MCFIFNPIPDPIIEGDSNKVYFPAEDSYLIIDYFKRNINHNYFDGIKFENLKNILEIGTGTGIIAIFLQFLQLRNLKFKAKIFASDISDEAIKCAKLNEKLNNINRKITFIKSDLFNSFPKNLYNQFNIIIFNPPYLPSSKLINEENKKFIDLSWNGGTEGFEILIEFLKNAKLFLNLKEKHFIYCITSNKTNLTQLNNQIKNLGYNLKIIDKKHIFFEDILLNRLELNLN